MLIDVRTAFLLIGALYIILPMTVLLLLRNYPQASVRYWCIGGLTVGISVVLLGLRSQLEHIAPDFFTFTFSNALLMLGYKIRLKSLRMDIGLPFPNLLIAGLMLLFVVLFEMARHSGSIAYRMELAYLWAGLTVFFLARSAYQFERKFHIKQIRFIWVSYLIFSLALISRSISLLMGWEQAVLFQNSLPNSIIACMGIVTVIYSNLAYLGVMLAKSDREGKALAQQNTKLENQVIFNQRMNQLLEEKNQLLSGLVKAKKIAELGALSASIAHEVNQPLAAIRLNAWNLKKTNQLEKNLNKLQLGMLKNIANDANRAGEIISTLMGIFKNETGVAKAVALMDIIQHLKLILASELSHKKIQLQIDVPPNVYVTIPESEIALVLLNLINNASRALAELSEANRVITISAQDNQQSTLIHVIDNGLGVPAHLVQNLFEIAKDSHSEGLGLGLWLIRHILERHDCQIEYQPNQQGGSIFTLNLPKAKQAKANEVTPYASRV